jgi:hypothetical protein
LPYAVSFHSFSEQLTGGDARGPPQRERETVEGPGGRPNRIEVDGRRCAERELLFSIILDDNTFFTNMYAYMYAHTLKTIRYHMPHRRIKPNQPFAHTPFLGSPQDRQAPSTKQGKYRIILLKETVLKHVEFGDLLKGTARI